MLLRKRESSGAKMRALVRWGTGKEEKRSVERYSGEKVQQQNKQRRIAIIAFLNHLRENEQQQLQQHHHHRQ
jgi:hypothetical protein